MKCSVKKRLTTMLERTSESKVLRDPIHGYIHVDLQVIWDLINTPIFQRLHRIHQLGGDFQVYHTAEHTRFSHSLGVYEIARRMVEEISSVHDALNESERAAVLCAALLHDLGHGPFSHMFEKISHYPHEQMTMDLIMDPEFEIRGILEKADPGLPEQVVQILDHGHPNKVANSIVSSQLDADRMDYLLRDAYETGTSYGHFDLERIMRTLRAFDGQLCIKQSGIHSVEDYIMARYQMYWQVYLHPDSSGYELLIETFMDRYLQVRDQKPIDLLEPLACDHMNRRDFAQMDDSVMICAFHLARNHPDLILADLASRILDRRLLDWTREFTEPMEEEIRQKAREAGYDPDIYVQKIDHPFAGLTPYDELHQESIQVLHDGQLHALSKQSAVVNALLQVRNGSGPILFYPKELRAK